MTETPRLAVGLMSGTSLDGIDAALVRIAPGPEVTLASFVTRPYEPARRAALETAFEGATARELAHLHTAVAQWAAEAVEAVLAKGGVVAKDLAFIAFHGQTVWHEPPVVSWQLGEAAVLAERFQTTVVSNFRARDVAAGGEGAPLVSMADVMLFGDAAHPRVLLNLGGMANLTYVPRRGATDGVVAFDTGPGMAVIDRLARRADPSVPFDRDGRLSASGSVHEDVVQACLADAYFQRPPPKSTGREHFGDAYAARLGERVSGADGVRTAVELTARSIAESARRWVPTRPKDVVVSGGGRRHPGVMAALDAHVARAYGGAVPIRVFDDLFFDGDAKEAVAFAVLGHLALERRPGNLPVATGAKGPRVLGAITPP